MLWITLCPDFFLCWCAANLFATDTVCNNVVTYSYRQWIWYLCLFMKQNCYFDRGLAQYKHANPPLSFSGINPTLLGFPKRYITLVYLKGLKSYQPSKFKRVDFLSFYLVKRTFRLHFYWQLLSPLRSTKVIYLFGKPRSVVIMPEKLKGGVACLYCARPLWKWQFCFINRLKVPFVLIIAVCSCLKVYLEFQMFGKLLSRTI